MGACVSKPKEFVGLSSKINNNNKNTAKLRRRRTLRRRVSNALPDRSYSNPAFQGSTDPPWSDAISSELDDEFYSVREDGFSVIESENVSVPSPKNSALEEHNNLSHNCLPCLAAASTHASLDKKKSLLNPTTPSSKRRLSIKLSFKWREEPAAPSLPSPKALVQRPIAGSSIPVCPVDKKMPDCWSPIEPSSFKVRGQNYFRDKKKDQAPNSAAFYPFGADVFISPKKIHHIARFVELPPVTSSDEVPPLLVVNVQMPLYPATIFQSESDGEGMNVVMYFQVSEDFSKELPSHFQESINKLINDEVERVRGFPLDTIAPFRERLKILGRLANADDLQLSSAERKLINAYNEKPVLSRPQHEFYLGENYLEIDIDMHRFSYISRKGFEAFQNRLKLCTLDFGLTIQGNKAEDLPEHMLCCIRLNELDHTKYKILGC
ncbi:hypothetical protein M5689_003069 [Euphorbia peplus]|nr:hypothetical protein M5689_003069 [Euphorbia peplus]